MQSTSWRLPGCWQPSLHLLKSLVQTLDVDGHNFDLIRIPKAGKRPLRAWDAADEFVIEQLTAHADAAGADVDERSLLIVGDSFGALSCALDWYDPVVVNESAAGREAIAINRRSAGLDPIEAYSILDELPLQAPADVVVVKIPKSGEHLVEILHRVRPLLSSDTTIIGAGMSKHIRSSTVETFERLVGPATTSLAKKKARLVHATFDPSIEAGANPWPQQWKAHGLTLSNHGGGFSPKALDAGTGLLLDALADVDGFVEERESSEPYAIADLGCGNGVVGLVLSERFENAGVNTTVTAIDDSALAVAATKASWAASGRSGVSIAHAHRMVEVCKPASLDLVVVNPPFHDDRVVGDDTAWSMFVDAHMALRPGGCLVVVGNRHLAYHAKLKKIFGATNNIAANSKFVVLSSTRT